MGAQVIAVAAKTGGCQMGVAVDETGHDHHAGAVDDGCRLLCGRGLGNGGNFAILDAKERTEEHIHFFVHGHNGDIGN